MVTMSRIRKEQPKKEIGLLGKMFGTHQTKPVVSAETKKAVITTTKATAKQMARGAGVMGRGLSKGLQRVGENVERSGMFEGKGRFETMPFVPSIERSEYLPTSTRYRKVRKVKKTKSRLQELQEMGLI